MDHYIDLTLRADEEFLPHLLMDALLAKLHRALVTLDKHAIGISFPHWRCGDYPTLGTVLRLHGSATDLQGLMQVDWLRGMRDHLAIYGPASIPAQHTHLKVERQRANSAENMRKRAMRRHGYSREEAREKIPESAGKRLSLPFTTQRSASTGQRYRLFIQQRQANISSATDFNGYGLSLGGTVPTF